MNVPDLQTSKTYGFIEALKGAFLLDHILILVVKRTY